MRIFPIGREGSRGKKLPRGRENCQSIVHGQRSEGLILRYYISETICPEMLILANRPVVGVGVGLLPYMGYRGVCHCEVYGFQAVYSGIGYINQRIWVWKRVSFSIYTDQLAEDFGPH